MTMNAYTCSICQKLYTRPVLHRPCGYSFDRQCLNERCPIKECNKIIDEKDLIVNYELLKMTDEHRLTLDTSPAFYFVLLDTSTSMRYSDSILPFATDQSRFLYAKQFLHEFFTIHLNSLTDKISLVTFDTVPLQRFDFVTLNQTHLKILESLTCEGKDTALFDSIDFCLDKFQQIKSRLAYSMPTSYLFILTDGANNFGKNQSEYGAKIFYRSRELQISGYLIHIGNKNKKPTETLCDRMKFKYRRFHKGDVQDLTNTIRSETQTKVLQARNRARVYQDLTQSNGDVTLSLINHLPNVPNQSVRTTSQKQKLFD